MTQNFKRLNLPRNPVKNFPKYSEFVKYGDQVTRLPEEILTDELLGIFKDAGIRPAMCFLFCQMNKESKEDTRVIHYDLTRSDPKPWSTNDDPKLKNWKTITCGINWEMTGSLVNFSWWNMDSVVQAWPVRQNLPLKFDELNSVHYVKRGNYGIPYGATRIESVVIDDRPILIRTNLPHQAVYSGNEIRIGISIRFVETWDNWDSAVQAFDKLLES
jgi:hypothetical protein